VSEAAPVRRWPRVRKWLADRPWFWPAVRYVGLIAVIAGFGVQKYEDDLKGRMAAMGRHCEAAVWQERTGDQLRAIRARLDTKSK
jgi:hypothetical protein